ncbi:Uncharacterized protein PBTT_01812 [Plasmodiophora brassicae]
MGLVSWARQQHPVLLGAARQGRVMRQAVAIVGDVVSQVVPSWFSMERIDRPVSGLIVVAAGLVGVQGRATTRAAVPVKASVGEPATRVGVDQAATTARDTSPEPEEDQAIIDAYLADLVPFVRAKGAMHATIEHMLLKTRLARMGAPAFSHWQALARLQQ